MSPQYGSHRDRVPTLEPGAPWASERPYSHVVLLGYTLFARHGLPPSRVQIGSLVALLLTLRVGSRHAGTNRGVRTRLVDVPESS